MTTATAIPSTTLTTVRVEIPKELSGPQWCSRYPGSKELSMLRPSFQLPVGEFIDAMERAGAKVIPNATFRPKERAYLMCWCWKIFHDDYDPSRIKPMPGVPIEWQHPTREESRKAAFDMAKRYDIASLEVAPALDTLHTIGEAIDMTITWSGSLNIEKKDGTIVEITSLPRTGMNPDLKAVGASYGVIKFIGGARDKPHWSTTGS